MSAPTSLEYAEATDAAYTGTTPGDMSLFIQSDPALQSDGFSAAAFKDSQGNIIIAYEGTVVGTSAYDRGTAGADLKLMKGQTPAASPGCN